MTSPYDYNYYQIYYPSAGDSGGMKTLSSVKPYLAGDPWFVRATFRLYSYNDARWKPLVGSSYTTNDGIDNWGMWLSPSYNLQFRVRGTSTELSTSGFLNFETNTWFEAWVSRDSDSIKIGLKKTSDDTTSVSKVLSSSYYLSINTAAVVTVAGWQNNPGEGFPGIVETVTIGKHYTRSLINDIITSPAEKGSSISIGLVGNIGHYSIISSLTSSSPAVARIDTYPNNGYLISPLEIGSTNIQCIVLDTNGFYPPINTSFILTVRVSTITTTLGDFNMTRTFGDSAFAITQPSSNSPGAFTYSVIAGSNVISMSGTTITIARAGTATVQASQAASGNYLTATKNATITINQATTSLTVSKDKYITKYILNDTVNFDVFTTNAESGYTRQFSSNNDGVITLPNTTSPNVTITGPGRTTVNVTQNATTNYLAVTRNAIIEFVIVGQNQTYTSHDMAGVNLAGTNLSTTTFNNCNLTGVNLYGVTVNSSTNFTSSNLSNVQSGRILGNTTQFPSGYQLI